MCKIRRKGERGEQGRIQKDRIKNILTLEF